MINQTVLHIENLQLNDSRISISGSKSISQRALIINFLGSFSVIPKNLSNSDDTFFLNKNLQKINEINHINVGNGGTTLRFLLPILSMQKKLFYVEGDDTLKGRPLTNFIEALKFLGVSFNFLEKENELPFELLGGDFISNSVFIGSKKTSQFISSLLLVAPYFKGGLTLNIKDKIVSKAYIDMTISMMKQCGINIFWKKNKIVVSDGTYQNPFLNIESDWTSLSYIYQLVAFSKQANINISSFCYPSIQKDSDLVLFFNILGVKTSIVGDEIKLTKSNDLLPYYLEWDVLNTPDLMPTYLISCFALGINLKLTGIDTLIYKESNRINTVKIGLEKFNATINLTKTSLILDASNATFCQQTIDTFGDHRIALAFSPLVLKTKKLIINNSNVIDKSYPNFWNDLKKIGVKVFLKN